jgi:hypothetical protein
MNNNFNADYSSYLWGAFEQPFGTMSDITSQGDYFTGVSGTDYEAWYPYQGLVTGGGGGVEIMDSRSQPNTGYYNTLLTPQDAFTTTSTNNSPLMPDYYVSDSTLFRDARDSDAKYVNYQETASIVKGLLDNKNNLMPKGEGTGEIDPAVLSKIVETALAKSNLALNAERGQAEQAMEIARALANVLANPTDDQKAVIDVASSLVKEMDDVIGKDAGANPELKKATDELLQAIANVLLAQAIPDLLKEGDLSNIRGIFSNLDTAKTKIMLEYNDATKPY